MKYQLLNFNYSQTYQNYARLPFTALTVLSKQSEQKQSEQKIVKSYQMGVGDRYSQDSIAASQAAAIPFVVEIKAPDQSAVPLANDRQSRSAL